MQNMSSSLGTSLKPVHEKTDPAGHRAYENRGPAYITFRFQNVPFKVKFSKLFRLRRQGLRTLDPPGQNPADALAPGQRKMPSHI